MFDNKSTSKYNNQFGFDGNNHSKIDLEKKNCCMVEISIAFIRYLNNDLTLHRSD